MQEVLSVSQIAGSRTNAQFAPSQTESRAPDGSPLAWDSTADSREHNRYA